MILVYAIVRPTLKIARFRHVYMIAAEVVTLLFYVVSIAFLPAYFGKSLKQLVLQVPYLSTYRSGFCDVHAVRLEGWAHCGRQFTSTLPHKSYSVTTASTYLYQTILNVKALRFCFIVVTEKDVKDFLKFHLRLQQECKGSGYGAYMKKGLNQDQKLG